MLKGNELNAWLKHTKCRIKKRLPLCTWKVVFNVMEDFGRTDLKGNTAQMMETDKRNYYNSKVVSSRVQIALLIGFLCICKDLKRQEQHPGYSWWDFCPSDIPMKWQIGRIVFWSLRPDCTAVDGRCEGETCIALRIECLWVWGRVYYEPWVKSFE